MLQKSACCNCNNNNNCNIFNISVRLVACDLQLEPVFGNLGGGSPSPISQQNQPTNPPKLHLLRQIRILNLKKLQKFPNQNINRRHRRRRFSHRRHFLLTTKLGSSSVGNRRRVFECMF